MGTTTTAKPNTTIGTGLGTSATSRQPQQAATEITNTTKYSQLPENVRKQIDEIEKYIQDQIHILEWITGNQPDSYISETTKETNQLQVKMKGLRNLLERDGTAINDLKRQIDHFARINDTASRYIERYKISPYNNKLVSGSDITENFFLYVASGLEERIQQYKQNIDELERHITSCTQAQQSQIFSPQVIHDVMKTQHESLLMIASKVAANHDAIERLCEQYQKVEPQNQFARSFYKGSVGSGKQKPLAEIAMKSLSETHGPGSSFTTHPINGTSSLFKPASTTTTGTGLFGATLSGTNTQTTGTTSIFGNKPATTMTNTGTSSLFGGNATATTSNTGSTSIFGGQSTQQPTGLFGTATTTATTPATGLFGQPSTGTTSGFTFGNNTSQPLKPAPILTRKASLDNSSEQESRRIRSA
ncbi:hypothetical protein HK098_003889 [Nowakowskiella sp. JEL0407]|nr:hypothetical protein HK098_003889 [Nowakowskiella sp. JEL0407]